MLRQQQTVDWPLHPEAPGSGRRRDSLIVTKVIRIQGNISRCSQPPVDTKTKVLFWYMGLILKQNYCFDDNGRLGVNVIC